MSEIFGLIKLTLARGGTGIWIALNKIEVIEEVPSPEHRSNLVRADKNTRAFIFTSNGTFEVKEGSREILEIISSVLNGKVV